MLEVRKSRFFCIKKYCILEDNYYDGIVRIKDLNKIIKILKYNLIKFIFDIDVKEII